MSPGAAAATEPARGPVLRQAYAYLADLEAEAFESWKRYRELIAAARASVAHLQVAELQRQIVATGGAAPLLTSAKAKG